MSFEQEAKRLGRITPVSIKAGEHMARLRPQQDSLAASRVAPADALTTRQLVEDCINLLEEHDEDQDVIRVWRGRAVRAEAERDALETKLEILSRRVSAAEQERDAAVERARMQAIIAEQATDERRAMKDRVGGADLCLEAVDEARRVLKLHFGGNHAFLDDDLIRGVVKMKAEIDAWRTYFPNHHYRPMDACIERK